MICISIILLLIFAWFVSTYNKLVKSRLKVKEAYSTMDVFLKKRFDLIPNLVETVKGYIGHENETLSKITELRSSVGSTPKEQIANEKEMSNIISRLLIVAENYPELKADKHFLELQSQLKSIENDIENARRYYNGTVTRLNTLVNLIPTNIVANMCKIEEEPFFEIEESSQREIVQVKFN